MVDGNKARDAMRLNSEPESMRDVAYFAQLGATTLIGARELWIPTGSLGMRPAKSR